MNAYETLGATSEQLIVIRLKNPANVAEQQSSLVSFVSKLAPGITRSDTGQAILNPIVYNAVVDEIKKSLHARTPPIDAEVSVIDAGFLAGKPLPTSSIFSTSERKQAQLQGGLIGVLGVGAVIILYKLVGPYLSGSWAPTTR